MPCVGTLATLSRQCWLFAVGSACFAAATVPGFSAVAGAGAANWLCFVGSWFFTAAAWMQLVLATPPWKLEWLSAAIQFVGTVLFNISTGAAVWAHATGVRRHYVWTPDALGSVAFLVSAALGVAAATIAVGLIALGSRDWQAEWINMIGSIAFGVSAVGAFVRRTGITEDALVANLGTFFGALCFLAAALLVLPRFRERAPALRESGP
ncbi:hypothetical protein [Mycolicibacterium aichiense]|uniref:Uncharacterized protein n=1 Tax=Mycolicibacterium aichiense TaxID=1799 RepID=A0AAD1HQK1_9MYCO|nr:hypothetical protein [Mycolicibacterium aichiense]MCV7016799.1 hypothetical protein [Mycolicibacterium aichiense]BBX09415.1 hypothetical protein MAIC_42180 [Mycolicibacterium aichiense]SUA13981.1 Uncharacterised protein [Mycolicibacterium aichiense]